MDRENAIREIKQRFRCTDFLEKSKGGLYCCPFCGSGHGRNGTGAVQFYQTTNTIYCRGGCGGKAYDVIDLYQERHGVDFNTAFSLMADEVGITIDRYNPSARAAQADYPTADYTAYYQECRERINDPAATAYLQRRGISVETARAYWIGFDPAADPANAPGAMEDEYKRFPTPRLIMPTSSSHYVGRAVDPKSEYPKLNPNKEKGGGSPAIFNVRALYAENDEIFVVEGIFDALSIIETGAAAIALSSTENAKALIEKLEGRRTVATLILCFDNDTDPKTREKIRKKELALSEELKRLNISHIIADICGEHKDPNAALVADRSAFSEKIEEARRKAAAKPDNVSYFIDNAMGDEIARFRDVKKTGFVNLDEKSGGLYSGLYIVAAISSLGKTTFCHQIADQLATAEHDVLFFSLEQSRLELVTKSVARITKHDGMGPAVTSLSIRRGYVPEWVSRAMQQYKEDVGDRLSIIEGNFSCTSSFIGDYVRRYIHRNGTRPVVFIDYLQILQTEQGKSSVKESVDSIVTALKRLSRELDLTVIVVSSVNRANYLTPIDFESLKESGGIEFTADVVWGLQLECLGEELFSKSERLAEKRKRIKEAKAETPRKIELVCLKNRYGIPSFSCSFDYYPENDMFIPGGETERFLSRPKTSFERMRRNRR